MDQQASKERRVVTITYADAVIGVDGRERVMHQSVESHELQTSDFDDDVIGCLFGLIINSICNADEPDPQQVLVQAIKRANGMSAPFRRLARLHDEWAGDQDFEEFVASNARPVSKGVEQGEAEATSGNEYEDQYWQLCRVIHKHGDPLGLDPMADIGEVDQWLGKLAAQTHIEEAKHTDASCPHDPEGVHHVGCGCDDQDDDRDATPAANPIDETQRRLRNLSRTIDELRDLPQGEPEGVLANVAAEFHLTTSGLTPGQQAQWCDVLERMGGEGHRSGGTRWMEIQRDHARLTVFVSSEALGKGVDHDR